MYQLFKLIDLGFKGCRYTWSNHRHWRHMLILEWLDRCLTNEAWLESYPLLNITHLPKTYHIPFLIRLTNPSAINVNKPFRLEKYWCTHPEFTNIVKESWHNRKFGDVITNFQTNVTSWSTQKFRDIFANKKDSFLG